MAKHLLRRGDLRLSDKAFADETQKVLSRLRMLRMFGDTSKEASRARVERCRNNPMEFARTYLPHYFTTKTQAEWHPEYVSTFKQPDQCYAIVAPRGCAKSTLGSFVDPVHDVCYGLEAFIVLIMENLEKATMQTWRIYLELKYNHLIRQDFGDLVGEVASAGDFVTLATADHEMQTRILALGAGMSARGLIFGQYRPTKIICDDLESRRVARNPKSVEKLMDIVLTDYLLALINRGGKFRIIGSIICRGSLLDKLKKNEAFIHLHFRAIINFGTPDERSTWEEHLSLEALKRMIKAIGTSRFMAEMQGDPKETDGLIKDDWIVSWENLPADLDRSKKILVCDPAFEKTGDFRAIGVINPHKHIASGKSFGNWFNSKGEAFPEGQYDIIEAIYCRKMTTTDFFVLLYDVYHRFKPTYLYIEGVFAQKSYFMNEYRRFTMNPKFGKLPIKFFSPPPIKKETRIKEELETPIEHGLIVFPPRSEDNADLEEVIMQLTRFGEEGMHDDAPDMLAASQYILHRKEKNPRRMSLGS